MSSESPPARKPRPRSSSAAASSDDPARPPATLRVLDWCLVAAFLALTFLLGVFPLKDTDFWWHLRTGDWIRQNGRVPTTDLYTYTVPDHRWVDLHWMFQVALSWGYAHGGVVTLNLAKCVITCVAVFLLIRARRRDWPVWTTLLAWLPALLVLSGRMYVRPETISLLYLSVYLAILFRWERYPALAWCLPLIQLAWVNTQSLFVLGPIVLTFGLISAMVRPGAFAVERRPWWRTVAVVTVLTGLACLVNPYGIHGALFPLQVARTMGNPIFTRSIAELTPIPDFIVRNAGWNNLPLRLHLATMFLGALSFIVPLVWAIAVSRAPAPVPARPEAGPPARTTKGGGKSKAKKGKGGKASEPVRPGRESLFSGAVFRFLLFAAFSFLSWRATRNSHQFAAVVGTVTAWNFGEWAAALRRRRLEHDPGAVSHGVFPRVATLVCIVLLFLAVASGQFYALAGEGRTIGLGEEPLWYPHAAVKFAGSPGMPDKFLAYHDGYAALYEYYHGPERKVFADARLEVIGPELYERYLNLRWAIIMDEQGWARELDESGRPAILAGHANNATIGAALMASPRWRCVWFDELTAILVHDSYGEAVRAHQVDFAARHFRPDRAREPHGAAALLAEAKALWNYAYGFQGHRRGDLARPMVLLGLDYARRIHQADPDGLDGWKLIGELEIAREVPSEARVERYRFPFDPVFDLSQVRATYALTRALGVAPNDFLTLLLLAGCYDARGMDEAQLPLLERLLALPPLNQDQQKTQVREQSKLERIRARLATAPPERWENLSELDRTVSALLASGRARAAADLLERAYPAGGRPWEVSDRIASLRLHLGEPERARAVWQEGLAPADRGLRPARVASTYHVEGETEKARRLYHEALAASARLFEAHYGLAVLEQDAGRAAEAHRAASAAVRSAPSDIAAAAARLIVDQTAPFVEH
jgi:hypothetical protein